MENVQSWILTLTADAVFGLVYPTFYSSIVKLRIKRCKYILIMFLIFMLLTPFQYIFPIPQAVVSISGMIINLGGLVIFAEGKFIKKIIYTMLPYAADIAGSSIYLVVRLLLTPQYQPTLGMKVFSDGLEAAILLLQIILSMFILSKFIQRKRPNINDLTAIYTIALMIAQMYMITFILYVYCTEVHFITFCIVIIVYMLIFALLTIAIWHYSTRMNKRQMKHDMIEKQYRFMTTQYEQLRNSYISYKKLRHDINDHLNVVNALAMQGKIEELRTYTNTITRDWEALSSKTFCDVPAVDIILTEKYNAATAYGIKTDFIINNIKAVNADNVYLSGIFANILNNALEAASHCDHEPYISLRCNVMMENLVITCHNSMPDYPYQKNNPHDHGYGLYIIDDLVKLLGGTFIHEHNNNVFTVIVTIPINERRTT